MRYARRKVLPFDPSARRPRVPRRVRSFVGLAAACLTVFGGTVAVGMAWPALLDRGPAVRAERTWAEVENHAPEVAVRSVRSAREGEAPEVGRDSVRIARVIDGDTVVIETGEHVRILNIDTAEMPPRSRCEAEERLALAAKARLGEMVADADSVVLAGDGGRDRDRFGRQLRLVRINGRDVGEALIAEGLAQPWRDHRAMWC